MKIFTEEFEDKLVNAIGVIIVLALLFIVFGVVGGIEQGLLW